MLPWTVAQPCHTPAAKLLGALRQACGLGTRRPETTRPDWNWNCCGTSVDVDPHYLFLSICGLAGAGKVSSIGCGAIGTSRSCGAVQWLAIRHTPSAIDSDFCRDQDVDGALLSDSGVHWFILMYDSGQKRKIKKDLLASAPGAPCKHQSLSSGAKPPRNPLHQYHCFTVLEHR